MFSTRDDVLITGFHCITILTHHKRVFYTHKTDILSQTNPAFLAIIKVENV